MIENGKNNTLTVLRITPPGIYLGNDDNDDVVLLPNKYIPAGAEVGQQLTVFIYRDSEDRLVATTLTPKIQLNEFSSLVVKEVNDYGAFLDWGLEKDLLVPYREQKIKMKKSERYIVYLYLDSETDRMVATSKIDRFLENEAEDLYRGDKVSLLIGENTDLGINVVVNKKYRGLLYRNEVFKKIYPGDETEGFVKSIREDGKIDISLQPQGVQNIDASAELVLEKLKSSKGFLALNDNSDPDSIMHKLQMSKKSFKKAIGVLFKQRLISIEEAGIYLLPKK